MRRIDPGDPYTPMGTGGFDFSAYEKSLLGWIGPQPHASTSGAYTLVPPTEKTKLAQALVVDAPRVGAWWLEFRAKPFRGVLVRFVDEVHGRCGRFAAPAILVTSPTGTTRLDRARGDLPLAVARSSSRCDEGQAQPRPRSRFATVEPPGYDDRSWR